MLEASVFLSSYAHFLWVEHFEIGRCSTIAEEINMVPWAGLEPARSQ